MNNALIYVRDQEQNLIYDLQPPFPRSFVVSARSLTTRSAVR